MSKRGTCFICYQPEGILRIGKEESNLDRDVFTCEKCWNLLKDRKTALPLMRGHLMLTGRGSAAPEELERRVDTFMSKVSKWKPQS